MPRLAAGAGAALMLAMTYLWYERSGDVRRALAVSQRTSMAIVNDDDLLRFAARGLATPMLGNDYVVYDALRRGFAPGTRVFVDYRPGVNPAIPNVARANAIGGRTQRLWVAMLPDYPIVAQSEVVVCPDEYMKPDDIVIARGELLNLIRRPVPAAAPAELGQTGQ